MNKQYPDESYKVCTKCKEYKPSAEFCKSKSTADGLYCWCRNCCAARRKLYRQNNLVEEIEGGKAYYEANKQKFREKSKRYAQSQRGKEIINIINKRYYLKHKPERLLAAKNRRMTEDHRQYMRKYYSRWISIPVNRLAHTLRTRLRHALRGKLKAATTEELLGCSFEYLRSYIESKFEVGMDWSNYGEWHIDHIIPCDLFNLMNDEHQKLCFNYRNLQPLWAKDNLAKYTTIDNLQERLDILKKEVYDH